MRESGWYWIKFDGFWKVAKWVNAMNGDGFFVESNGECLGYAHFIDEIDERRIEQEVE
ncbi:MAG: hypothetical protein ACRDBQ_21985 [Shewanella sp.]